MFFCGDFKTGGEGGIDQTALGLFDPLGFALTRSSPIAMQSVEPSFRVLIPH